jgi:hypothetical protein
MTLGQAAGTAAALAKQTGERLRTIDVRRLRSMLADDGVLV